ncbi:hypothetical protein F5Y05DRAFT_84253 [Hypoxylon sp. FL0543]|nr:hypothetical protein F5Y05DRAFT_84253 [Hypoxylon sp. FL0543]
MANAGGFVAPGAGPQNQILFALVGGLPPVGALPANHNPFANDPQRNEAVLCVVCGAPCKPTDGCALYAEHVERDWTNPWLIKAKPGFLEWCRQPSSARAYHRQDNHLFDVVVVDHYTGGPEGFWRFEWGRQTQLRINTLETEMYLPIHGPCLDLAEIFCLYQSRFDINFRDVSGKNGGEPSSIAHLYEIWTQRALMSNVLGNGRPGVLHVPIDEPNGYLGAVYVRTLNEYATFLQDNPDAVQEANPAVCYMETTRAVLKNLVPLNADNQEPKGENKELLARLKELPVEIRRQIGEALEPFDDLGPDQLVCTRVIPSYWWKMKLFRADLIPWLFDLTPPGRISYDVDDGMDWELLCRQLAQPDVFGPGGILRGHRKLENRFRIWRVLNSSRLGHMGTRKSH